MAGPWREGDDVDKGGPVFTTSFNEHCKVYGKNVLLHLTIQYH